MGLYLLVLIWIVLFKSSINPATLFDSQTGFNLIPFAASSSMNGGVNFREIILNCIFFIPFGLLLSVNFKETAFKWKLAWVALFSVSAEVIQLIFAMGATDITDIITNTFGGFIGLTIYVFCRKFTSDKILDRTILAAGLVVFLVLFATVVPMLLRRLGYV